MTSTPHSAVILVVDQLPAAMLGPYGNTMVETVNFNRLASRSLLLDSAFANSVDLTETYRRWWAPVGMDDNASLPNRLARAGVDSVLITDDLSVAEHVHADFDRVIALEPATPSQAADIPEETQLASFFAQATAWITEELEPGTLCWLHSRGLSGAWDAPSSWRERLIAEDDPAPPSFFHSPSMWLDPETTDPDELLGIHQAAAAQILLLDEFLGILLDQLDAAESAPTTLFCLTSPRGCALGEHGLVGGGSQLYNESVHVPMLVRLPGSDPARLATRSLRIIQVDQLRAIVEHWMSGQRDLFDNQLALIDSLLPTRNTEYALISSDEHESLQTHAWKLIRSKMEGAQLFAKPDDRFEVNDVSDRCPEIVEKMIVLLEELLAGGKFLLPDELVMRKD